MYKKSVVHYISKVTIDVLLVISCLCTVAIPFFYKTIFDLLDFKQENMAAMAVVLFASGLICAYILFVLRQMYKSLLVGNPFTDKNVGYFRSISVACMLVALIFAVKMLFAFTVAALVICAVFVVGCLFCLTLKDLFKQAINYKSENELTI